MTQSVESYKPVKTMPEGVLVCFSSIEDGSLAVGGGKQPQPEHIEATKRFLDTYGFIHPETRIFVSYGEDRTYTDVARVTEQNRGEAIPVDAVYSTESGVTMSVPVADCVPTVVYDPITRMLGVLHLGRHASVAGLIEKFVDEVTQATATNPRDWYVWMGPSLQPAENRMQYFDPPHPEQWTQFQYTDDNQVIHIDIPSHNMHRFEVAGVQADHIYVSRIDTFTDARYFSHRAAIELMMPERQGRMLVAAMMRP